MKTPPKNVAGFGPYGISAKELDEMVWLGGDYTVSYNAEARKYFDSFEEFSAAVEFVDRHSTQVLNWEESKSSGSGVTREQAERAAKLLGAEVV